MKKPKTRAGLVNSALVAAIVGAIAAGVVSYIVIYVQPLTPAERERITIEKPIREVIEQEANLVLEGRIDEVVLLFAEEAFVRDAAGGNTDQEIIWKGKNEIAERYRNLEEFIYLKHEAIEITVSSDKIYARAIADTIGVYKVNGVEVKISSNQGEKWTFKKINDEWKIIGYTYNLP